ncbi:NADP-dependent oxidoreductase [Actinokineospora sp. UTMC 2448]|uniref:NADP-dependent oxidoreductase n=1 Tax=Actinokineospora sp. UTMC 2448 TaxID=2268449 RepID=UPI0021643B85|nr:NADP-dependent oxidoreductase [Actinokineospora sp. UTMC 2448]UVS77546.1 Quinone oxidoreductase 1 [Actinokineospora sp. UTMC 2448]
MKAVVATAAGGPDVLELVDLPDPLPGSGQIRVRVKAAGVQPFDVGVRQGWAPRGIEIRHPQLLGNEFAGVVDLLGPDVTAFAPGDAVVGFAVLACYAEYVVVNVDQVVVKPAAMSFEQAGGLSGSGQAAHTALEDLRVGAGDTLLVHAAAGGVGTVAVQLAKQRGATVIGTAGAANHEYLRELGAIPVTYGPGLVERVRAVAPNGVDAALDGAGAEALRASVELVADRSRIGTLVAFDLVDELGVRALFSRRSADRLAALTAAHPRVHVRATYPLADAAAAHRDVETGHGRGKVVIVP